MSNEYHCYCKNDIAIIEAKFRAFGPNGEKGEERKAITMAGTQLPLPAASGNTVKIEYWDNPWQDAGTFGPINSGDEIVIDGALSGFKVTINGKTARPINEPVT